MFITFWLKGKEIIEFFINQLKEEGITHAEPWQDPLKDVNEDEEKYAFKFVQYFWSYSILIN